MAAWARLIDYLKFNRAVWWLFGPLMLFPIMMFVFSGPFLIKWLSWLLAAVACGVVITYTEAVIKGLKHRGPMPRYTHLAIGIFLGWLAIVENRTWVGVIRLYPLDTTMRDSYFVAFYIYTSIVAAVFHLTAPGAIDGRIPTANWIKIGVFFVVGIVVGIAVTTVLLGQGWASYFEFNPFLNIG